VVIDHEFTLRSYEQSNVISNLSSKHEVSILLINTSASNSIDNPIFQAGTSKLCNSILAINSYSYWTRKRKLSNSFKIRILNFFLGYRLFYRTNNNYHDRSISAYIGVLLGVLRIKLPKFLLVLSLGKVKNIIKNNGFEAIIYPSIGGPMMLSDSLASITKVININLIVCIDNWDNISSKAVLNHSPNTLLVWGEQSQKLALEIHQIPKQNIGFLGSPRIEFIKKQLISSEQKKSTNHKSILFAGGSQKIEIDHLWLIHLNQIKQNNEKILYLPHPINYYELNRISADINLRGIRIEDTVSLSTNSKKFPTLDIYVKLFNKVDLVISPLSTMLLESVIFQIPAIGIDFSDPVLPKFGLNSEWAMDNFEHFHEFKYCKNFTAIRNHVDLESSLDKWRKGTEINEFINPKNRDYFYEGTNIQNSIENALHFRNPQKS
jgi:hypothetical protein